MVLLQVAAQKVALSKMKGLAVISQNKVTPAQVIFSQVYSQHPWVVQGTVPGQVPTVVFVESKIESQ